MVIIYAAGFAAALFLLIKKKIDKKCAGLVMAGSLAAVCLYGVNTLGLCSEPVSAIGRDEKSGREKTVELEAQAEGEKETIRIRLKPQEYSEKELTALSGQLLETLDTIILGENESLDKVTESLCFPEQVGDYPFILKWHTDAPALLSAEGKIGEDIPKEGAVVEISVQVLKDGSDFRAEHRFFARLFPSEKEEAFWKRLEKEMSGSEEATRLSDQYVLPESFEGKEVRFYRKKSEKSGPIFLLAAGTAIAVAAGQKREKERQGKKRLREMEREYAEIISRMAMLIGAGMTVSGAFKRMAGDYGRRKQEKEKPLYEELLITCREIDSGISEGKAYQNLGTRCRLPCVIRFTSLLLQYSRSGGFGLKNALKEETNQALQERKERARRLGEEAGTKLLLPMTWMLVLVMVVIMIPAFTSFGI